MASNPRSLSSTEQPVTVTVAHRPNGPPSQTYAFGHSSNFEQPGNLNPPLSASWPTIPNGYMPRYMPDGSIVMVPIDAPHLSTSHGASDRVSSADALSGQVPANGYVAVNTGNSGATPTKTVETSSQSGPPPENRPARRTIPPAKTEDVIELTSSDEDDGAKLLPGDSTYRGRASNNRVKSMDGPSRPRTRGKRVSVPAKASRSSNTHVEHENVKSTPQTAKRPRPRPRRTVKSKPIISSDDEDHGVVQPTSCEPTSTESGSNAQINTTVSVPSLKEDGSLGTSALPKVQHHSASSTTDLRFNSGGKPQSDEESDFISSSDLPELAAVLGASVKRAKKDKESKRKLLKKLTGLFRSSKRWRSTFLDLEATEDNGEDDVGALERGDVVEDDGLAANGSGDEDVDMDEYDLEDPFIDDSDVKTRGRGKSSKSKDADIDPTAGNENAASMPQENEEHAGDPDAFEPGFELEDFARQREQEVAKQVEDDRCMAAAITRNQAFMQAPFLPPPKSVEPQDPSTPGSTDPFLLHYYRRQFEDALRRTQQAGSLETPGPHGVSEITASRGYPTPATPSAVTSGRRQPLPHPTLGPFTPSPSHTAGPGKQVEDSVYATPSSSSASPTRLQPVTPPQQLTSDNSTGLTPDLGKVAINQKSRIQSNTPTSTRRRFGNLGEDASDSGPGRPRLRFTFPETDEVNDEALQDELLAKHYVGLPLLRRGIFIPWNSTPGPGLARFSYWAKQTPGMDADLAFLAIGFVHADQFINPSRACPSLISIREINGGSVSHSRRMHAYVNGAPAIFTSCIYSEVSCLRNLTSYGLPQNMLQGKLHSQEFERFVGFVCMAFGIGELHANLAKDSMHFVGRPVSRREEAVNGDGDSGMFTKTRSPSTKQVRTSGRVVADNFVLDSNNDVPIYDARDASDFNFGRDLPRVAKVLPAWEGEIPYGSFVMVGYTVAVYKSNAGNWTVSCNIQWAIVIGVPPDEEPV